MKGTVLVAKKNTQKYTQKSNKNRDHIWAIPSFQTFFPSNVIINTLDETVNVNTLSSVKASDMAEI
jgi:galactose-1-phosphate uridylyltransferase